ncbi:hypothetical protein [Natrinema soli]|uniref:Intracellular proteinase inhibitor BsuPI domain-containing protein n=1 Tax=Natrinema soli TaxID=1930624 RepID=A0ABD5SRH6_9EURY|nr:hypothetical protein [Natrinema soli]
MYNGSDEQHVFAATVTNENDETIFKEEFDLDPNTGDENWVIEGTPATITVTIDDRKPVMFSWDPQTGAGDHSGECQKGSSISVSLWYNQQDGEGLKQVYGCETAQKR